MTVRLYCLAMLLGAATTGVAIAIAPIAAAAPSQDTAGAGTAAPSSDSTQPHQSCAILGATQSQCQSPGNSQVYDAPPQVDYYPYAGGAT